MSLTVAFIPPCTWMNQTLKDGSPSCLNERFLFCQVHCRSLCSRPPHPGRDEPESSAKCCSRESVYIHLKGTFPSGLSFQFFLLFNFSWAVQTLSRLFSVWHSHHFSFWLRFWLSSWNIPTSFNKIHLPFPYLAFFYKAYTPTIYFIVCFHWTLIHKVRKQPLIRRFNSFSGSKHFLFQHRMTAWSTFHI